MRALGDKDPEVVLQAIDRAIRDVGARKLLMTCFALVISPDDMNAALPRVIVAPITSKGQLLGCRPEVQFKGRPARILLDQIRCVDKARLAGKMGEIDTALWHRTLLTMLD